MLQQICEHLHNYFTASIYSGKFEIAESMISLPLLEGQRFLISGSVLNDGMYTYHEDGITNDDDTEAAGLADEVWTGTVSALAVPPAVIALTGEISQWVGKYGDIVNNPYQSENVIGAYSYTKATTGSRSDSGNVIGWQEVFRDRLNRYRRISF